jgi:hypothetical protein
LAAEDSNMASLSESELLSLLSSLSMSRTRSFLRMIEDECTRLVCMRASTRGRIRTLNTPPLSEKLRDLVSVTSRRFKIRDSTMPEGDLEKPMSLRATSASRIPTLLYSDLVPYTCPLESIARYGLPPPIIAGDGDQKRVQQQRNHQPEGGRGQQGFAEGKADGAGRGSGAGKGEGGEGKGKGKGEGEEGEEGEEMAAASRESGGGSAGGRSRGRGRPMGVYRPGRMAEARQAAAADARATIGSKTESSMSSLQARPSMGIYRPGRMVQARETASGEAMDMDNDRDGGSTRRGGDEAGHGKAMDIAEKGAKLLDDGMTEGDEEDEGDEEMVVVHDYEGYRLDPTPKTWGEQERRQPYVELEGSSWRCDDAWMLRGEGGNGSVAFCVQPEAGSSPPCSVTVGLAPDRMGKMGEGCTFRVTVSKDSAVITRHGPRGEVVACASSPSAGDDDRSLDLPSREGGARPPPEKFWIVVRGGLVAVGSGPHVAVGSIIASLSGEAPARPVKHVGFGLNVTKFAGKGRGDCLTVFRISVGGKLCSSVASASHLRLMTCRNEKFFAREAESHRALVQTPPTRW